jgi:hypothetical protein
MEEREMRNPHAEPLNEVGHRLQQLSVETARAQESAELALSLAKNMRLDMDQAREVEQGRKRSITALWVFSVILLLAGGALFWYGYRAAEGYEGRFASLPDYGASIEAANLRADDADKKLATWANDWKSLGDRVSRVEQRVSSDLKLVRNFAEEQAGQIHRQLLSELDNRTEWLQMRIARMETTQESQRARITELQEELAGVRSTLNEQTELAARARDDSHREMDGIHQRVAATRGDLDALARQSASQRVDFEVSRGHASEPVAGISITLKNTSVPYQRVEEGWVHIVPDGKILWIRSQGVQQPVMFYSQSDNRPYQLVFTRITRDGAVGYLVHPGGPPETNRASGPLPGEADLSASAAEAR